MDRSLRNRYQPIVQHISLVPTKIRNSSSSLQKKIKLNQKTSYYSEKKGEQFQHSHKRSHSQKKQGSPSNIQNGEPSHQELQSRVQFIEYQEFDVIQENEVLISLLTYYQPNNPFNKKNEECQERFDQRRKDVIYEIQKKFPFIKIIEKQVDLDEYDEQDEQNAYGLFEVQICSYFDCEMQQSVIYSKKALKQLPSVKYIIQNIKSALSSIVCELTVKVDCMQKDVDIVCNNTKDKQNLIDFEGLQVILQQKENGQVIHPFNNLFASQTSLAGTFASKSQFGVTQNSVFQTSSNNNASMFKFGQSPTNQGALYKSTFHGTIQDSFLKSHTGQFKKTINKQSKEYEIASSQKRPKNEVAKSFSLKAVTNNQGVVVFKNVIKLIEVFDIVVCATNSKVLKPYKTTINLKELCEQQGSSKVLLNCFLEREDVVNCQIELKNALNQKFIDNAEVRIATYNFLNSGKQLKDKQDLSDIQLLSSQNFSNFFVRQGYYFIHVRKPGFYSESKEIQVKKGGCKIEFTMTQKNQAKVQFYVCDILTKNPINQADITIFDDQNERIHYGKSAQNGVFTQELQLMSKISVQISAPGFMSMNYEFDLHSKHASGKQQLDLLMIPSYQQVSDYFEILIFQPHNQFKINFQVKDSEGQVYDKLNNAQNSFMEIEQQAREGCPVSKLTSFTIENSSALNYIQLFGYSQVNLPNQRQQRQALGVVSQNNNTNLLRGFSSDTKQPMKPSLQQYNSAQKCATKSPNNENKPVADFSTVIDNFQSVQPKSDAAFGLSICKSVQNSTNCFLKKRMNSKNKGDGDKQQVISKYNPKKVNYINEKIVQFDSEDSIKVYILHKNQLLDIITISQNLFTAPKQLLQYSVSDEKLDIIYEKKTDILENLLKQTVAVPVVEQKQEIDVSDESDNTASYTENLPQFNIEPEQVNKKVEIFARKTSNFNHFRYNF